MIIRKLGPAYALAAGVLAVGLAVVPAQAGTNGSATPPSTTAAPPTATTPPAPVAKNLAAAPVLPMTLWDNGLTSAGAPWSALVRTRGLSDGYVVDNMFAPGASTGWHSHAGPSVIFVVQGTVTNYDSSAPGCKAKSYPTGTSFTDAGGSDVHMLRNEGPVAAETIAVQFIPSGQPRKTPAAEPANCHVS